MTVKAADIQVGSVLWPQGYAAIREVCAIKGKSAHWIGYDRSTGKCCDQGYCSIHHLAQWASRFATEEETTALDRSQIARIREMLESLR